MKIIIGIFVGSIVVIIGALFGAWLNRNSAKKTVDLAFDKSIYFLNRQEFRRNCSNFISAFAEIVDFLDSNPHPDQGEFKSYFKRSFSSATEEVAKFRVHLPKHQRMAFNTAWQDYRTLHSFIMPQEDEDYNDVELKKTTQFHIDHLLKFTEYEYIIKTNIVEP